MSGAQSTQLRARIAKLFRFTLDIDASMDQIAALVGSVFTRGKAASSVSA
jgi:hypothetical protein